MKRHKFEKPDFAWAALISGVVAYDWLCPPGQTMSERVDSYLEHPRGRYITYAAIGITALHLANVFDRLGIKDADPFYRATQLKRTAAQGNSNMSERHPLPTPLPTKFNRDYWSDEATNSESEEHRSFAARMVTRIAVQNAVKIGRLKPPVFRGPEGQDGA